MHSDAVLSTKRSILSALGTRYNDLYYSAANSSVSLVETTFSYQNVLSLPAVQLGSTSQINIPIDQFIQEVVLHLRLNLGGTSGVIPNTAAVTTGWGYALLNYINWTMGASSTTAITLTGPSIWMAVAAQCDMAEKRTELWNLAGPAINGDPGSGAETLDAYITIPLPFSTACDKLPIDSTLLSNNIVLTFAFNTASSILPSTYTGSVSFDTAEVLLRQGALSDKAASLRQEMIAYPELLYSYPFIHYQHFQAAPVKLTAGQNTVTLNAFTNGDLLGIVLWFVDTASINPTVPGTVPQPFNIAEVSDVLATFNGVTLFRYNAKSYKLTNCLIGDQGASFWLGQPVSGTAHPYTFGDKTNEYPIFMDFSRLRSACMQDQMFNTWKIANQNILVQFSVPQSEVDAGKTYQPYALYMYNGVVEFQSGTSAVFIA